MKTKSKLGRLEQRKLQIVETIGYTKKLKQTVQEYDKKLEQSYKTGKLSYLDYKKAQKSVFKGRSVDEWVKYYDQCIAEYQRQYNKCDKVDRKFEYSKLFVVLAMALVVISLFGVTNYTGFSIVDLRSNATPIETIDDGLIANVSIPIEVNGSESNESAADLPEGILVDENIQHEARVGMPVTWTKTIVYSTEVVGTLIELPANAEVVSIKNNKEENIESVKINNAETPEGKVRITEITSENVTLTIEEPVSEITIDYTTEAPTLIEEEIESGKRITVSSDTHYENIVTNVTIDEVSGEKIRLYRIVDGERIEHEFTGIDSDSNGLIDKIEWITPHLSTEVFEIIVITKAEHLDANKVFISDIYNEVKELDGVWSETINDGEYVRVTFEENLTNANDITLYPRITSGSPSIEVYEEDSSIMIVEFTTLNNNEYNQILLTSLEGEQDAFDLRIVGGAVEFDHIIDPFTLEAANISEDIALIPAFGGGSFTIVRQADSRNLTLMQTMYANGSNYTAETTLFSPSGNYSTRVSAARMNENYIVMSMIDGAPDSDFVLRGRHLDGTNATGFTDTIIDNNAGVNTDVDICAFNQSTYMAVYMDSAAADLDASFVIYSNSTQVKSVFDIDAGTAANSRCLGQDCITCVAFNDTAAAIAYYDQLIGTIQIAWTIYTAGGTIAKTMATLTPSLTAAAVQGARLAGTETEANNIVFAYCDGTDNDISFQVIYGNGSVRVDERDVNTTISGCSGAAGTHVDVTALNTSDGQFVIAYDNTLFDELYYIVYNASGIVMYPTANVNSSYRIATGTNNATKALAVTSFDAGSNTSICNGLSNVTFIAAWNTNAGTSIWQGYYTNGSTWNGDCIIAQNSNPTNPTIVFNSTNEAQTNYTNESLIANFTCTDLNAGDVLSYDIYFLKNDERVTSYKGTCNASTMQMILEHANTTKGEKWNTTVNITDNNGGNSSTVTSAGVYINNAKPEWISFQVNSTNADNHSNGTIQTTYSYIDVDGDVPYVYTRWYMDNLYNSTFENLTNISTGNFTDWYNWTLVMWLGDGALNNTNKTGFVNEVDNYYENCITSYNGNLTVSTKIDHENSILACRYITILNGGTLILNSSGAGNTTVNVSAYWVNVNTGGVITSSGQGYIGDQGPGTPIVGSSDQGAGYGGTGGDSAATAYGGHPYGSIEYPLDMGSGGDSGVDSQGKGGGAIYINTTTLTVNGMIDSNASECSEGGGSGGSILINTTTLAGSGLISTNGIASPSASDGGGGGGRIAIYYTTNTFSGVVNATGGDGITNGLASDGGAGTIYWKSAAQTNGELWLSNGNNVQTQVTEINSTFLSHTMLDVLNITNNARLVLNTSLTTNQNVWIIGNGAQFLQYANFTAEKALNITIYNGIIMFTNNYTFNKTAADWTLNSGTNFTHLNNSDSKKYMINITAQNFTIQSGASINVGGKGYAGTKGAGAGTGVSGGGSYGGQAGGDGFGAVYGSMASPDELGSGGNSDTVGSEGAGAIYLNVTDTFVVNGTIAANGTLSTGAFSSGSGGSVYIYANKFTGTGNIWAIGGKGTTSKGGGGGGRIAIYSKLDTFEGSINATGGSAVTAGFEGNNGTIFRCIFMEGTSCVGYNNTVIVTNGTISLRTDYSLNASVNINKTMNVTWKATSVNWTDIATNLSTVATFNLTGINVSTIYNAYDNGSVIETLTTNDTGGLPGFNKTIEGTHDFVVQYPAEASVIGIKLDDSIINFGSGYYDPTCTAGYASLNSNLSSECWTSGGDFPLAEDIHLINNNGTVATNVTATINGVSNAEEVFCGAGGCTKTANANITVYAENSEAGSCTGLATENTIADFDSADTARVCNSLSSTAASNLIKAFIGLYVPKDTSNGAKQIVVVYTAIAA